MADAMSMIVPLPSFVWPPLFAVGLVAMVVFVSYRLVAKIFKWLTLVLFAYVITAFLAQPDWGAVFFATFAPHIVWNHEYFAVLVGIFGTTISPYLFFWQSSQEVEEERVLGRRTVSQRRGATDEEMRTSRADVVTGMLFSNLIMYFIILTTATTLHAHGKIHIESAKDAAEALRPLAGSAAYLLFTLGIVGTGMLAIPVLAGSSVYAVAESAAWGASIDHKLKLAPKFYSVLILAVALGMCLGFAGFNSVRMMFLSAVLNGILAPPLIVLVVLLTSDKAVMGHRRSGTFARSMGWLCAGVMTTCAVGLLIP